MKRKSFFRSLLPFLSLLVIYLIIITLFYHSFEGDEDRFLRYANNLVHGFYTHSDNPDLLNGPGYPLVLLPFVAWNINLLIPKLLNGIFVFIGVLYFYKTLRLYTKEKYALIAAFLIGLYPPLIRFMILLYSESLAFMVICGLTFEVCKLYQTKKMNWKRIVAASFYLGLLVLVKVIFFQVIVASLFLLAVGLLLFYRNRNIKLASIVLLGGFFFITPYLIYTYSLTGKPFYLGTQGGEILYHRSTPYENEWGNWFSRVDVLGEKASKDQSKVYQNLSTLSKNHRDFYLKTEPLTHIERDSAMKVRAIQNMRAHPRKYLKNTASNIGRLLFHYPFSYRAQNMNAYGYMIPNMFIMVIWIISIYPFLFAKKNVPFEIKALMIFTLIYGFGMVLLGGRGRHFIMMVPAMVLFSVYVYTNCLKITLVKTKDEQ